MSARLKHFHGMQGAGEGVMVRFGDDLKAGDRLGKLIDLSLDAPGDRGKQPGAKDRDQATDQLPGITLGGIFSGGHTRSQGACASPAWQRPHHADSSAWSGIRPRRTKTASRMPNE